MNEYLYIVLGLALLIIGVYLIFRSERIRKNGVKARGIVVDLETRRLRGSVTYAPVIEFETLDGRRLVKALNISSYPVMFDVGQEVGVIYHKDDPEAFELSYQPLFTTVMPFVCILAGAALVIYGVYEIVL